MTTAKSPGQVTVSIEGVAGPATFSRLPDALAALWQSLRMLPLGWTQYDAYRTFFGPGVVERVEEALARDGELAMAFTMAGRSHVVRVVPTRRAGPQG
ncbi:hypothetical protein [Kitasatospora sp. NPDC088346]|uniref:hypothetical protein n=1 Tax=Kitasatospora sp. NPDC088346 TaxID=3364073 RepID=UPI0038285B01